MKKSIVFVIVLVLVITSLAYAQDDGSVVVNYEGNIDGQIQVDGHSLSAEESYAAGSGQHIRWGDDGNGAAVFPGGQQVGIGDERDEIPGLAGYVSEFSIDGISTSPTQNTSITLISGCVVVIVPSSAENAFVISAPPNSVLIPPPWENPDTPEEEATKAVICLGADGGMTVTRLTAGTITVLSGDVVIVSDVQEETTTTDTGEPVLGASGVGGAWK